MRTLGALKTVFAVAGTLAATAAGAYAGALSTPFGASSATSGADPAATCDGSVRVGYDVAYSGASGGYVVRGVHVSDVRGPTRSWADRLLPGDGLVDLPTVLAALDEAGWDGLYDLEIFSDNGTFGSAHADSLWDVPTGELARRGRAAMLAAWESRPRLAASTTTQRQEEG